MGITFGGNTPPKKRDGCIHPGSTSPIPGKTAARPRVFLFFCAGRLAQVKLVPEVDPTLIGGFTLEWGYTDPVNLYAPTHGVDMSLKQPPGRKENTGHGWGPEVSRRVLFGGLVVVPYSTR